MRDGLCSAGSASVIQSAGRGVSGLCVTAGFIAFSDYAPALEMVVEEPVAGCAAATSISSSGRLCGFASGWNYWVAVRISCHGGTDRGGVYPVLVSGDLRASAAAFFVIINAINLTNIKVGEMEFWFVY